MLDEPVGCWLGQPGGQRLPLAGFDQLTFLLAVGSATRLVVATSLLVTIHSKCPLKFSVAALRNLK